MLRGAKKNSVGATVEPDIPVWVAPARSDQSVNRLKFIEPQVDPVSCVVAYTRCRPLKGTAVKSLSETHPDFGFASEPVEVHRYVEGRVQFPPPDELETNDASST